MLHAQKLFCLFHFTLHWSYRGFSLIALQNPVSALDRVFSWRASSHDTFNKNQRVASFVGKLLDRNVPVFQSNESKLRKVKKK
jgi:hypothetical protein